MKTIRLWSRRSLLLALSGLLTASAFPFAARAQTPAQAQAVVGLTQYAFGTPSGDETEMLCDVNRARSNPSAEGQLIVNGVNANFPGGGSGIDLNVLLAQFQSYPARPPLAFNADLNASAQQHTADMIAMDVVQHNSPDGTPYGTRIISFGYANPRGENCSGMPTDHPENLSPWATEEGYEIDQNIPSYGHRLAILEPTYPSSVEIGVAQVARGGWNTEDFGANQTPPLLTGAVFTDNAGTGFYASGEGVASVVVTAPGASSFYATTVASGAYTLPLDLVPAYTAGAAAPTVQVVFTDALGNVTAKAVTLTHTPNQNGNSVYYDPQMNVRYDNAAADLVEPASAHPAFFAGEAALSQGVDYLVFANGNVFGYYAFLADAHYLYHFDLGYEYLFDAQDGQDGLYLYDFASQDFFYTSPSFPFPYLYDFGLNTVLYYYPDPHNAGRYNTDGVRWFYDFATGQIVSR